jgi:hypothetical protein
VIAVDKCTVVLLCATAHFAELRDTVATISATLDALIDLGPRGPSQGDDTVLRYAAMRRMVDRAHHAMRLVSVEFTAMMMAANPQAQREAGLELN